MPSDINGIISTTPVVVRNPSGREVAIFAVWLVPTSGGHFEGHDVLWRGLRYGLPSSPSPSKWPTSFVITARASRTTIWRILLPSEVRPGGSAYPGTILRLDIEEGGILVGDRIDGVGPGWGAASRIATAASLARRFYPTTRTADHTDHQLFG
jgi:hypothetical protein